MSNDLPPWKTVYYCFRKFQQRGIRQELNDALREKLRAKAGRKISPSAAIVDSQSVRTTLIGGPRGYDAGKSVKGRKRHIIIDMMDLLLAVVVHRANIDERRGVLCAGAFIQATSKFSPLDVQMVVTNYP